MSNRSDESHLSEPESPLAGGPMLAPGSAADAAAGAPSVGRDETEGVRSAPTAGFRTRPFTWRELTGAGDPLQVRLRLGATRLSADAPRGLRIGTVVRLDQALDEPVEIYAGRNLLGYGRVVLVDGKLAVQVTVRRQPSRRQSA